VQIEHVALYTQNLERAKTFYCQHFGFTAGERYHNDSKRFESYFLSADNGARLELMRKPGLAAKGLNRGEQAGWAHLAISVGSEDAVNSLHKSLCASGCESVSHPRLTGDGYYEACVYDLDGNRLEITA